MHLLPRNTEDNMNAGLAHQFGGCQVVLLIKAGLQFHKYRHALSVLRCGNQCTDHLRMLGHAVLRNHNLTALRIVYRFIKETDEMIETVIRIIKQQIPLSNAAIHEMLSVKPRQAHGSRLRQRKIDRAGVRKRRKIFQIQVFVTRNQFLAVDSERFHQKVQKIVRHLTVIHKTADRSDLAFLDLLLQLFHHIFRRNIVNKYIGITRNLTAIAAFFLVTCKYFIQIHLDDVFQKHQVIIAVLRRKYHKTGDFAVGDLQNIKRPFSRVTAAQADSQIKAFVTQKHTHLSLFHLDRL